MGLTLDAQVDSACSDHPASDVYEGEYLHNPIMLAGGDLQPHGNSTQLRQPVRWHISTCRLSLPYHACRCKILQWIGAWTAATSVCVAWP